MNCKLCGFDKPLVDAHVIPRSFHRIDPNGDGPPRLVTNEKGRHTQKVRKGVYDSTILCVECEHRFSEWDDYGDDLFLKGWDQFEKMTDGTCHFGYHLPAYDYPKLKLFILSVLWRASVSSHVMFSKIDLGGRETVLKQSILQADPGSVDQFGVLLQAFDSNEIGILNPHLERFDGIRYCRLYLGHVIAFIKVDSRPLGETFRHLALTPYTPLRIAIKNFGTSPERAIMQKLVIADKERSRTSR
ncbi:MAG: hypothetical protein H7Y42_02375 [Chitinophagaceae bacterium]|nr:hypothetical protein [Chitinophagaceae bacterium]